MKELEVDFDDGYSNVTGTAMTQTVCTSQMHEGKNDRYSTTWVLRQSNVGSTVIVTGH